MDRLFSFARGSAFISSLESKNARYAPGVFRIVPFLCRAGNAAGRQPRGIKTSPRKGSPLASLSRARIPKRSSGPFRGPRRAGGAACRDGRSFRQPPSRGRWRGLPRRKEFRLPVFSPAFFNPSLTPSVAFGDSSLGEGAFRNGGPLAVERVFIASLLREVAKRSFDGRSFVSLSFLPRFSILP